MARSCNRRNTNGQANTAPARNTRFSMKQVPHDVMSALYALDVSVTHVNVVTKKAGKMDVWGDVATKDVRALREFAEEKSCELTVPLPSRSAEKGRGMSPVVMLQIVFDARVGDLPVCDQMALVKVFNEVCGTVVTLDQFEYAVGKKANNAQVVTAYVMITGVPDAGKTAENIANPRDPAFRGQRVELSVGSATLLTIQTSEKPAVYKRDKHVKGQGKKRKGQVSISSNASFRTVETDSPQAMHAAVPDSPHTSTEGYCTPPMEPMCAPVFDMPPMPPMYASFAYTAAPTHFVPQEYGTDSSACIVPVMPSYEEHESFAAMYY